MNSTRTQKATLSLWIDSLQLITLVVGLTVVGSMLGSRDATLQRATSDISELSRITQDLASIAVRNETTNAVHSKMLDDIQDRISLLESGN